MGGRKSNTDEKENANEKELQTKQNRDGDIIDR
jgi:hypothetical protein